MNLLHLLQAKKKISLWVEEKKGNNIIELFLIKITNDTFMVDFFSLIVEVLVEVFVVPFFPERILVVSSSTAIGVPFYYQKFKMIKINLQLNLKKTFSASRVFMTAS